MGEHANIVSADRAGCVRERLLSLLTTVLGAQPEDLSASFYDHGGDSLLFLVFVSRLKELGDVDFSKLEIDGNIALSSLVERLQAAFERAERYDPKHRDIPNLGYLVPITANRYAYLSKMGSDAGAWSLPSEIFRLDRQPSREELERIALDLVDRHDGLRLDIRREGAAWHQEIGAGGVEVRTATYAGVFSDSSYDHFLSSRIDEACAELGLTGTKVILLMIASGGGNDAHLTIVFHHAFVDGISLTTLEREVLGALSTGREVVSEARLPAPYSMYAADQLRRCADLVPEARRYWSSLPWDSVVRLQFDRPEHCNDLSQKWTRAHNALFSGEGFDVAAQAVTRKLGVSVAAVLVAALAVAYHRWSDQGTFLVDLAHHGRPADTQSGDFSETVGWINQTVPLVISVEGPTDQVVSVVEAQMSVAERLGRTFSYCRYLCLDPTVQEQFQEYPEPEIAINILAVPPRRHVFYKCAEVYPINRLPRAGRRVHQIAAGAVREGNSFRLALDHNSRAIEPSRAQNLLNMWAEELSACMSAVSGAVLVPI